MAFSQHLDQEREEEKEHIPEVSILDKIDKLVKSVRKFKQSNTYYVHSIVNLHIGEDNKGEYPIKVLLWNGKDILGVDEVNLDRTFYTKAEAEEYIASIYEKYPAPPGRENGPLICYPDCSSETMEQENTAN